MIMIAVLENISFVVSRKSLRFIHLKQNRLMKVNGQADHNTILL